MMNKKKLSLALVVAGVLIGECLFAQQLFTAPMGVQTYSFRRSIGSDPAKVLDTIRSMGITEIESGSGRMAPEEFRKLCDERGISIPSTGAGYDQLVNKIDSVIYRAKALGAKYVMCSWIPHTTGSFNFENAKKAVDDFN